jgi:hypothetical protein
VGYFAATINPFFIGGFIMLTFNGIGKIMTKFLENIETEIKNIHIAHGIDSDAISKQVADAVTTGITPLQSKVTELQGQVAELQKAAQDIVTAINNGDSAGAQTIATAAANFVVTTTPASATNNTGTGETTEAVTTGETGTTTDGEAGAETATA